jgi:hypothetical protein
MGSEGAEALTDAEREFETHTNGERTSAKRQKTPWAVSAFSDMVSLYYRWLFPAKDMIRWLTYGTDAPGSASASDAFLRARITD